jgi:hypothetical protein
MTDHTKSLPVRTETAGDVAVKIVDKTTNTQQLTVNADGSINVNTSDLSFIDDKVDVSGSEVSLDAATIAALAPTAGAATEAKQDTQITILNDIKDNSDLTATAQNQLDTITAIQDLATEASLVAQTAVITSIDSKLEADNIRQQILKSIDRQQDITYADFGTKTQRVTEINYNSALLGAQIAKKTITYTLVGNKYRRDSIDWSIV